MSRKIIFRAKDKFGKNWVYGYLTIMWGLMHIQDFNDENTAYEIDPNTLGQCTGSTDKSDKEICEGDLVSDIHGGDIRTITWHEKHCGFYASSSDDGHNNHMLSNASQNYIVVGNVHDNPELLEK